MKNQYKEAMRQIRILVRNGTATAWGALIIATKGQEELRTRIARVFNTNIDALENREFYFKMGYRDFMGKHYKVFGVDSERNSIDNYNRLSVRQLRKGQ